MKKITILMFTAFSLFLIASCGDKDEVAEALIQYNNEEWVPINEMENEKLDELSSRLNDLENEGKDKEIIAIIEDEILPVIDEVLDRLEDAEPELTEIKKLNDLQMEAEQLLRGTFEQDIIYYEGGDVSEEDIEQNNKKVWEKSQGMIDYRDELIDKYNLEYVKEDEGLGNFRNLKREED